MPARSNLRPCLRGPARLSLSKSRSAASNVPSDANAEAMPVIELNDLSDDRLEPYRSLKDRDIARDGGRFIAEAEQIVRRLLNSGLTVESVLLAQRRAAAIAPLISPDIPVYVLPDELMQ